MSVPQSCTPRRIVCLTEETTEWLYMLGQEARIVGISGYTVRPPQARQQKPRISAFTTAKIPQILALEPDLVLGFSDLQADIAAELIRHGVQVMVFNQRSVDGIFAMMFQLAALVGEAEAGTTLINEMKAQLQVVATGAATLPRRPRVYFEEWDAPLISAIRWVSELMAIAGGDDCFPELAHKAGGKDRIIADADEVIRRDPEIIIGSWCGKKFRPEHVCARPGWDRISAVRQGHLYEIKSPDILQPGPAALTSGLAQLQAIINRWAQSQ